MGRLLAIAVIATVATTASAQDKANPTKSDDNKVICKREVETGSLVRAKKICMTKRDWQVQAASAQAEITRNVGSGSLNQQ